MGRCSNIRSPFVTKRWRSGSGTTLRRVRIGTTCRCQIRYEAIAAGFCQTPDCAGGCDRVGHCDAEPAALMASRTAIWTCSDRSRPRPCVGWGHPQNPSRPRDPASKHAPRGPGTGWSGASQAPSAPCPIRALPGASRGRRLRRWRGRRRWSPRRGFRRATGRRRASRGLVAPVAPG